MTHPRRDRGFTMMEAIIAGALALGLISVMYGAMSLYIRSFAKEEEGLERTRRVQTILDTLRRDFATTRRGLIDPGRLIDAGVPLVTMGYDRGPQAFIEDSQLHHIFFLMFTDGEAHRPYQGDVFAYQQRRSWLEKVMPDGSTVWEVVRVHGNWKGKAPAPPLPRDTIPGTAPTPSLHCIAHDEPGTPRFLLLDTASGMVLWAYHPKPTGPFPGKSLLRWTHETGIIDLGEGQLTEGLLTPHTEWTNIDRDPGGAPSFFSQRDVLVVDLIFAEGPTPGSPRLPSTRAESHSVLLWGN